MRKEGRLHPIQPCQAAGMTDEGIAKITQIDRCTCIQHQHMKMTRTSDERAVMNVSQSKRDHAEPWTPH